MAVLAFELFSEEIPARMQRAARQQLEEKCAAILQNLGVTPTSQESFATPRRLGIIAHGLPKELPAREEEKRGPRYGAPDAAIEGFCRGLGLTKKDLEVREVGKDSFYFAVVRHAAEPLSAKLAEPLSQLVAGFNWPKTMRWGKADNNMGWVRPLRSILCLVDDVVVPVKYGSLTAGRSTLGHRFMSERQAILTHARDYPETLHRAHVVEDVDSRANQILHDAQALARKHGGELIEDKGLLEEVSGLVEWPVVLAGKMDERFLAVPEEVLMTSMKSHQKYFSVRGKNGKLAPVFITVANIAAKDGGKSITAGNERVLRARLADAEFFWQQDRKKPLQAYNEKLETVTFHAKLGTIAQKIERITALTTVIAEWVNASVADAARAAELCKADLATGMVGEFPELQGIMGGYYARESGESPAVAEAIRDHYAPQGPNDRCPSAPASVALALADKTDTLVGMFAAGEAPTGSRDPFALRRAALGILRLILSNNLRLPLKELLEKAIIGFPPALLKSSGKSKDVLRDELMGFFADRLKVMMKDEGYRHDIISAVFDEGQDDDMTRLVARAKALRYFLEAPDGERLIAAYRRAANIVKTESAKDGANYNAKIDAALLKQKDEQALHAALKKVEEAIIPMLHKERFGDAMGQMLLLKTPLDDFFTHVMVNVPEENLRRNRLRLLAAITRVIGIFANFDKLEG
ncbi:glycine--tRNA ligase subunit beta [bacterium]|nr:glycine--tRNA ligase subunit beta [bacterium]